MIGRDDLWSFIEYLSGCFIENISFFLGKFSFCRLTSMD